MIEKDDVIAFFDMWAPRWDADMVRDDRIINTILDNAGVKKGTGVLDVGCGTGVLVPYYLERGVLSVTGVDISPKMAAIARSKFKDDNVTILCCDAETDEIGPAYDSIVIYNAFPHFREQEKLLSRLSSLLVPGGILTVAHGMSREKVISHHSGSASRVTQGLPTAEELAETPLEGVEVTTVISDDRMFQVCWKKTLPLMK